MSTNSDVVSTVIDRVWNGRDPSAADDYVAPDLVSRGPMTDEFQGREGFKNFANVFLGAFQVTARIVGQTESDGWVTTLIEYTGLNNGSFMGKPPTNRTAVVRVSERDRVVNGMIVETEAQWDPENLMAQLYG